MEELRKLLHKLQFDYYEHGSRMDTIIPDSDIKPILEYIKNNFVPLGAEVKVNFTEVLEEKKNELRILLAKLPKNDEDDETIRKKQMLTYGLLIIRDIESKISA